MQACPTPAQSWHDRRRSRPGAPQSVRQTHQSDRGWAAHACGPRSVGHGPKDPTMSEARRSRRRWPEPAAGAHLDTGRDPRDPGLQTDHLPLPPSTARGRPGDVRTGASWVHFRLVPEAPSGVSHSSTPSASRRLNTPPGPTAHRRVGRLCPTRDRGRRLRHRDRRDSPQWTQVPADGGSAGVMTWRRPLMPRSGGSRTAAGTR
jgi:hypothetical protein